MPDSRRLPRLSDLTASSGDLIAQLEMEADLPGSTWKRLYLVALKRMATMKASRQLGHLCAAETYSLAFHRGAEPEHQRWCNERLTAIEARTIRPQTLKTQTGVADPEYLFLCFQHVRNLLEQGADTPALQRAWKRCGGGGKVRDGFVEIVRQEQPIPGALTFIAKVFGYRDEETVSVILRHAGFALDQHHMSMESPPKSPAES